MRRHQDKTTKLTNSALELMEAGASEQNRRLLLKGIRRMRKALRRTRNPRERGEIVANTGVALVDAFEFTCRTKYLSAAIRNLRRGMHLMGSAHPEYVSTQTSLAAALLHLSEHRQSRRVADRALGAARAAAKNCPPAHNVWELCQTNLAAALENWHRYSGGYDVLTEAIEVLDHVANRSASPRSGAIWTVLGALYQKRFDTYSRSSNDLDGAVHAQERAEEAARDQQRDLSSALAGHGSALRMRHLKLGQSDDAVRAVDKLRESVAITRKGDPELPRRLSSLATALVTAHEAKPSEFKIDEAIEFLKIALSKSKKGPYEAQLRSNLGNAFAARFDEQHTSRDAKRAFRELRAARRAGRNSTSGTAELWCSLGESYADLYSTTGKSRYIRRSILSHRRALTKGTAGRAGEVRIHLRLADALVDRGESSTRHLPEAGALYLGVATSPVATPLERAIGWYRYGHVLAALGRLADASNPWTRSIDEMSSTVPHWLPLRDGQLFAKYASGVAADATAATLAAGDQMGALAVAEKGRAVLLNRRLDDPEIQRLRVNYPDIAGQLDETKELLASYPPLP